MQRLVLAVIKAAQTVSVALSPTSAFDRILLQKSKVASVRIFGETLNAKRSTIRIASVALSKLPMSLA